MSSDLITSGGAVTRPTKNAGAASAAIAELREQGANVLVAASLVEDLPPDHRLMIRKLEFDAGRDFYPTGGWGDGQKFAPSKRVLEQISSALGVQWRPDLCVRLDGGSQMNVASFKAVAVAPDPATGQPRMFEATYELDLRDGSALHEEHVEKLAGLTKQKEKDREIKAFRLRRRHIVALADTGARLRVIRQIAPVRSDYTQAEIRKPFVTVTMVYQPGIDDPETRRIVAERAAQARIAMYYGGALAQGEPASAPGTPAPLPPQPTPAPVSSLDVDEVNEAFRALANDDTPEPEVDPLEAVPLEARVWCAADGKLERYPTPAALAPAPRATRVFVVRAILEATSYDYAGAMERAGKAGTPVESLPDSWLAKLYESAHAKLEVEPEVVIAEFDDDDIPFD